MVMTSVIYDDMLITGRSLDGKMSFKFTAKNTITTEISQEKPDDIMAFVKENIFDILEIALQSLTNDEELWAEVREEIMVVDNSLKTASYEGGVFIDTEFLKVATKVEDQDENENSIHQRFSSKYQDYRRDYREYEYDVQVHYHFPSKSQKEGKMDYQLELTTDGKTTIWK